MSEGAIKRGGKQNRSLHANRDCDIGMNLQEFQHYYHNT